MEFACVFPKSNEVCECAARVNAYAKSHVLVIWRQERLSMSILSFHWPASRFRVFVRLNEVILILIVIYVMKMIHLQVVLNQTTSLRSISGNNSLNKRSVLSIFLLVRLEFLFDYL